jgi:RNA polymerase sigma-70 factor (ECF subfamily)
LSQIEPDEFRSLMLGELEAVFRLAYHLTHSTSAAEDLVQQTFVRALQSRDAFRWTDRGPRPWLFRILHNLYATRAAQAGGAAPSTDAPDAGSIGAPGLLPPPIDWEQLDQRLRRAIEQLPPMQRAVVLFWALEGMSYTQIAEVTESPVGTVMSRLYRARQFLAEQVADRPNGHPRAEIESGA